MAWLERLMTLEFGSLGNRAREIREAKKISFDDMAKRCGWSIATQSRVESGKTPLSKHHVKTLARELAVREIELFINPHDVARDSSEREILESLRRLDAGRRAQLLEFLRSFLHKM